MRKYCPPIFAIVCCVLILSNRLVSAKPGKLIIDTDGGADDATAILLTLSYEAANSNDIEILGITCVYGNTNIENVEQNILKTLTIANRSDIPVYSGARKSLLHNFTTDDYFGKDGFGDFNFTETITADIDRSKHAALALIEMVMKYPGEVSILALGPLTNIALAIALEPSFSQYVRQYYIMGASVEGHGNMAPNVEFNFSEDPESNFMVLNSTVVQPCILFPWETVLENAIPKVWRREVLGGLNSRAIKFLNLADRYDLQRETTWKSADTMAAAIVLWPELVTGTVLTNVSPVTDGAARGSVLVDYSNTVNKAKNTIIIKTINVTSYKHLLLKYFA